MRIGLGLGLKKVNASEKDEFWIIHGGLNVFRFIGDYEKVIGVG